MGELVWKKREVLALPLERGPGWGNRIGVAPA